MAATITTLHQSENKPMRDCTTISSKGSITDKDYVKFSKISTVR
jgi:hypothetical protein